YRKYKKMSPWCDVEDVKPRCAQELKKCYKTLIIHKITNINSLPQYFL
ncbi:hypothetical protein JJQ50_18020, partial [Enterobacter cloacae]|nr:hypothetical protein [Enterobacter cloacae]